MEVNNDTDNFRNELIGKFNPRRNSELISIIGNINKIDTKKQKTFDVFLNHLIKYVRSDESRLIITDGIYEEKGLSSIARLIYTKIYENPFHENGDKIKLLAIKKENLEEAKKLRLEFEKKFDIIYYFVID